MEFVTALLPEIILVAAACVLFVLAASRSVAVRVASPWIALLAVMGALVVVLSRMDGANVIAGLDSVIVQSSFTSFIKIVALATSVLLVLVNWPTDEDASGNSAMHVGSQGPEYFGLMLLSLTGVMLVALANDLILLFLAIELASIPTYIMVSISRPVAVAQEAMVKYFFLGALSAALTLLGLAFVFGATGEITLVGVGQVIHDGAAMNAWLVGGGILVMMGMAFKLAAFPLHFYAPDVYTGAATPLTALLSFVPKAAGIAGLIRLLYALSGNGGDLLSAFEITLWVMAIASMTIGNVLGLMQLNVKRMMACSSIAHSGYMLAGIAVAFQTSSMVMVQLNAFSGVLFYLAAYAVMNVGIFAVLMMIPAKADPFVNDGKIAPATSAETFGDIAGTARENVGLGMLMTVCCLSLIGIPLTAGFLGKFYLLRPMLDGAFYVMAVVMVVNAAISAGYYLRVIAAMFLREARPADMLGEQACTVGGVACMKTMPLVLTAVLSAGGALFLGMMPPAAMGLRVLTMQGAGEIVPARLVTPVEEPAAEDAAVAL